jgi:hypothetical protein
MAWHSGGSAFKKKDRDRFRDPGLQIIRPTPDA